MHPERFTAAAVASLRLSNGAALLLACPSALDASRVSFLSGCGHVDVR